jgi:hypothetical protein
MKRKTRAELEAENKKLRRQLADLDYSVSKFVGSKREKKKNKHFHRPSCKWAKDYLLNSKNLIEFDSHQEAVDASYKPCKTCRA